MGIAGNEEPQRLILPLFGVGDPDPRRSHDRGGSWGPAAGRLDALDTEVVARGQVLPVEAEVDAQSLAQPARAGAEVGGASCPVTALEHRVDAGVGLERSNGGPAIAREVIEAGELAPIKVEQLDDAIYLPVNRGSLIAVPYDTEQTLLVYHLSTVVGGFIPDAIVRVFSRQQVEAFIEYIENNAANIYEHYIDGHELVYDGEGIPLPTANGGR